MWKEYNREHSGIRQLEFDVESNFFDDPILTLTGNSGQTSKIMDVCFVFPQQVPLKDVRIAKGVSEEIRAIWDAKSSYLGCEIT